MAHARITCERLPRVLISPVEPSCGGRQRRLIEPAESSNDRQPLIRSGHSITDDVGTPEAILRAVRLERVGPDAEIVDLGEVLPTNLRANCHMVAREIGELDSRLSDFVRV